MVQMLSTILEKELLCHKSLLSLAERKTEIIKKNDIQSLNDIMTQEQAHIAAINQLEQTRQQMVRQALANSSNDAPVLSDVINHADAPEKSKLQSLQTQLLTVMTDLKHRNHLNQQMVYQSLQFINVSLDLVQPQQPSMNYSKKSVLQNATYNRSMFNSKA